MSGLYDLLAVPFGYIIGFFYDISQNYIFSILVITIITRLILLPSTIKQQRSSASQMRLQAKVRRIQEMYKGNQQKINEETQALYQREGFNPMSSGCLPMLIQFPVMIGLYSAIRTPLTSVLHLGSAAVTALTDAVQQVAEISSRGQATLEIEVLKHFSSLQGMVEGVSASDMQTVADFSDSFSLFGINLADTPQVSEPSLLWLLPIISGVTALLTSIFMLIRQKKQNPDMAKNPMMGCTFLLSPASMAYRQISDSPIPYSLNSRLFSTGFGPNSSGREGTLPPLRCSSRTSAVGRSRAADMAAERIPEPRKFFRKYFFQKSFPSRLSQYHPTAARAAAEK